jgi:retinol dehydrogenase 12
VIASDIWRRMPFPIRPLMKVFMKSTEEGAETSVYCATAPELDGVSGRFYTDCREKEPNAAATPELGAELWQRSAEWTAQ